MSSLTNTSVRLIRHATILLDMDDTTFLIDPMFASQGEEPTVSANPAVPFFLSTENQRRNPLVPMPDVDLSFDAVVVTHSHDDHFDETAKNELATDVPLFCQPDDAEEFARDGFSDVRPVKDQISFQGVTIHRRPGRHGQGFLLAWGMGPVSGFVFEDEDTVYVASDTVWYDPVEETLDRFDPDMVVLNGGEAQFNQGKPITMGVEDISAVREATEGMVVVVHMEAINHCLLSRDELRSKTESVHVPGDGELINL